MDFASLQMLFCVNGVSVVNKSEIAFTANAYKSAVYLDCLFRLYYLDCSFAEQLVISLQRLFLTLVKGSDCPCYLTNCLTTFQFICHYMQYYVNSRMVGLTWSYIQLTLAPPNDLTKISFFFSNFFVKR